jgi:hypothetical protein
MDVRAAPLLRQLAAGFSLRWSGLKTRIIHKIYVGFAADRIALGKIFLQELRLSLTVYHSSTEAYLTLSVAQLLYSAYFSGNNKLHVASVAGSKRLIIILICAEPSNVVGIATGYGLDD